MRSGGGRGSGVSGIFVTSRPLAITATRYSSSRPRPTKPTHLKRTIFESELGIGHKMHLRGFVENIDDVADWAEDVADRLAIYVIKRTV